MLVFPVLLLVRCWVVVGVVGPVFWCLLSCWLSFLAGGAACAAVVGDVAAPACVVVVMIVRNCLGVVVVVCHAGCCGYP